jgi:hypothetical protein
VKFYPVLYKIIAEHFANKATLGKEEKVVINGEAYLQPIP